MRKQMLWSEDDQAGTNVAAQSIKAWLAENQLMSGMTSEPEERILGINLMIASIRI